jgi:hypothetical protein
VRDQAGEKRTGSGSREKAFRRRAARPRSHESQLSESDQRQRGGRFPRRCPAKYSQGRKGCNRGPAIAKHWIHQFSVGVTVPPPHVVTGSFQRTLEQNDGRTARAVERMRQRRVRMHPLEAVGFERQGSEKRRAGGERMNRRPEIVNEARQRQGQRAACAADGRGRLDQRDRAAGLRQRYRGSQTVRSGANDNGVVRGPRKPVAQRFVQAGSPALSDDPRASRPSAVIPATANTAIAIVAASAKE